MATQSLSTSNRMRSGIANGARFHIVPVDARTMTGRRFRELVLTLEAERGGADALDTTGKNAIRAYALLIVERELIEARRASGEEVNAELYGQLVDRCDRLARRMGPATHRPGAPTQTWDERLAARKAAQCAG